MAEEVTNVSDLASSMLFDPTGKLYDVAFSDDYAKMLPAALARAEWEDYRTRFMPYEDELMQKTHYMNPGIVQEEIDQAQPYVSQAIDMGQATQRRRLQSLGKEMKGTAAIQSAKGWDRQRSLSTVDAANRIRQRIATRSRDIAFGGLQAGRTTAGASGGY
jgi:hypothetical protein